MRHLLALTVAGSALVLGATPALAKSYYTATPAVAPTEASFVTRSVVWKCDGATCAAPKAGNRDQVMCELAAKEMGQLASFTANGSAFDAAAMEKCNARAK